MANPWISNAIMYVTVPYNKVLFSILHFDMYMSYRWVSIRENVTS